MIDVLVGYKGASNLDTSYFFCPYIPGMTAEQIEEVNVKLRESSRSPTEIQQRIMRTVRNEDQLAR
jgi:hypothetical protein